MGKRQLVGLTGIVAAGVAMWGCQSSRHARDTTASPPATGPVAQAAPGRPAAAADASSKPAGDSGVRQASYQRGEAPLRIDAAEVHSRLTAGEAVVFLDVNAPQASSPRILGALALAAPEFRAAPSWPHDQLMVVY